MLAHGMLQKWQDKEILQEKNVFKSTSLNAERQLESVLLKLMWVEDVSQLDLG